MFIKYSSIENHYQEKHINRFVERYPELMNITYVLQEKIHGANIQFIAKPNGEFFVAKRSQIISPDDNFYGVWDVVSRPEYQKVIEFLISMAKARNMSLNLYGELFGSNIQKGVDYGQDRRILFFDLCENGEMLPYSTFISFAAIGGFVDLKVPLIGMVKGLENALNYNVRVPSLLGSDVKDNIIEGVVIKPYSKVYRSALGSIFYIKKKNEEFKEKQKARKKKIKSLPSEVAELHNEFLSYITENRLEGIFSKNGMIESVHQKGDYIRWMLEDAKEDFMKENEEKMKNIEKKNKKCIFNAGKIINKMIDKHL